MKIKMFVLAVAALAAVSVAYGVSGYNGLVNQQEAADAQWSQVENVYQRRADLVPNLVETVKGAASFERETLTAVVEARARIGQPGAGARAPEDPAQFAEYQKAQDGLSSALSRLLVVVERYPELTATASFRDLQTQLEGTENRITVERMRFNDVAREFNAARRRFPINLIASMFGDRFRERPYFRAREGAESAPQVKFP